MVRYHALRHAKTLTPIPHIPSGILLIRVLALYNGGTLLRIALIRHTSPRRIDRLLTKVLSALYVMEASVMLWISISNTLIAQRMSFVCSVFLLRFCFLSHLGILSFVLTSGPPARLAFINNHVIRSLCRNTYSFVSSLCLHSIAAVGQFKDIAICGIANPIQNLRLSAYWWAEFLNFVHTDLPSYFIHD